MAVSRRRAITTALAVATLVIVAATLLVRAQPVTSMARLILAVGAPYVAVGALAGLVLALWGRRSLLALVAVFLVTASAAIQVSWYYLGHRSPVAGEYTEIRVLSSNVFKGRADASLFTELARQNADVITVSELTPEAVERFRAAGLEETFPHAHLIPAPEAGGIGIWSRFPMRALSVVRHRGVQMPAARVQVPGVRFGPVVASVHVFSPVADRGNTVDGWGNGMAGAKAQLANFAAAAGPGAVIVGGDYNSTPDMRQFRDLLTDGYRDAVEQTGSGFAPTFPSDTWYPPVITIDHVLTREAMATSVRTVDVEGADHRGLLVAVKVPLEPV